MEILNVSPMCSPMIYEQVFLPEKRTNQQSQKFMRLLATGIQRSGMKISVFSKLPINPDNCPLKALQLPDETWEGIPIHYAPLSNRGCTKNISYFFYCLLYVYRYCKKHPDTVVMNDLLMFTSYLASYLGAKLARAKVTAILTDMPLVYFGNTGKKPKLWQRLCQSLTSTPDAYLPITEQMNDVINVHKKPYKILIGLADEKLLQRKIVQQEKFFPRVCLYAGSLFKNSGIVDFARAFSQGAADNWEFHIYGSGLLEPELRAVCRDDARIKYFGTKDNEFVMEQEYKASLLVNPRKSGFEYTKYSFPSKNIEYMSTGTPVLTTDLPGMPKEYRDMVYLIQDESISGMTETIKTVTALSEMELFERGKSAKEFIIQSVGNIGVGKRIADFVHSL